MVCFFCICTKHNSKLNKMQNISRLSFRCRQIRYFNTHVFDINPEVKSALSEQY